MISIKTPEEIQTMAEGGKILAGIMEELKGKVQPGIKTLELDRLAESLILKSGGTCSFKGYGGFPACLCTSINEEIVHAVPSGRMVKEGDILSLDLGLFYKGFHSDMALTVPVGKISPDVKRLVEVTEKALEIGIEKVKPGNRIGDIGRIIQKYVEREGFNVVRELCGHGIGREIHEDPEILNCVSFDKATVDKVRFTGDGNVEIKEGMVLCLEPMVTVGDWHIKETKDGFGYKTKDDSLSCHFEHTLAVTKNGAKILTVVK
ncbi:MAG: type I methionyl aminopeptidase [Candidatus Pacebacteria bacterium]|nr:type I methionyl aminopeptidase [Candidatus Paceibacterota bacterium]